MTCRCYQSRRSQQEATHKATLTRPVQEGERKTERKKDRKKRKATQHVVNVFMPCSRTLCTKKAPRVKKKTSSFGAQCTGCTSMQTHTHGASGNCGSHLYFIVHFHRYPQLVGPGALISIKALDCPTSQSELLLRGACCDIGKKMGKKTEKKKKTERLSE